MSSGKSGILDGPRVGRQLTQLSRLTSLNFWGLRIFSGKNDHNLVGRIWMFPKTGAPPKSSILLGFSKKNTIHCGVPQVVETPIFIWKHVKFKQLYQSTATQRWRRQGAWEADAFAPTASAWRWLMAREDRGLHKGVGGWHWTYHWKMLFFWKWNSFSEWPSFKIFGFPYFVKKTVWTFISGFEMAEWGKGNVNITCDFHLFLLGYCLTIEALCV